MYDLYIKYNTIKSYAKEKRVKQKRFYKTQDLSKRFNLNQIRS